MADTRRANRIWTVCDGDEPRLSFEAAQLAVLMDIRDELQALRGIFSCSNFLGIPWKLAQLEKNTRRPRKKKPAAPRRKAA